jgi:hypothetical protein
MKSLKVEKTAPARGRTGAVVSSDAFGEETAGSTKQIPSKNKSSCAKPFHEKDRKRGCDLSQYLEVSFQRYQ